MRVVTDAFEFPCCGLQVEQFRTGHAETVALFYPSNTSATNTSHTTEVDPSDVTAETLLLWGQKTSSSRSRGAETLASDIGSAEVVSLEVIH